MLLYRVARARYASDLSGEGARLNGGRWNSPGTACLYTSGNAALAVLEFAVQFTLEDMPEDLVVVQLELPDDEPIRKPYDNSLPTFWHRNGIDQETREFGDKLLRHGDHLGIRVPSAVVPFETNVVLRPSSPRFATVRIREQRPLRIDSRLKR